MTEFPLTLRLVDAAAVLRAMYGDSAEHIIGRKLPRHNWRFEVDYVVGDRKGSVGFHAAATADYVVKVLQREGLLPSDDGDPREIDRYSTWTGEVNPG